MNLSFAKLLSLRAARMPHALSPRRLLATAVLAAWSLASVPAYAQDASHDTGETPSAVTDGPGEPGEPGTNGPGLLSTEEKKDLPDVALTGQIVFQVLAAEVALQRKQPAPAYQTYLALARDTHDPRMAQRATEIALMAQSPPDALSATRLWQQYAPNSERAAQIYASLLVLTGKPDDAAPALARELAKTPAEARGNAVLAMQQLLSRGPNHVGGLLVLRDLLKNDMDRPEAQLAIARQQLTADDEPGARKSLEQALALKPDYLPAAMLLAQMGPQARKEGLAAIEKYVQQNPKSHDGRLALAQMYLADDRLDDAQKQFEAMHKNNKDDLTALMALALIKIQQKSYPDAEKYLKQYAQKTEQLPNADPGQAYLYLAQLSAEQNKEAAANAWLDKIAPGSPYYVPAQITRAQQLVQQGKTDDARKLLASLQPSEPRDQVLIARTDAAILFDEKHYQQAETRLAEAIARFPGEPDLIYDYAMAAEKNGHYKTMETQLRQLIRTQPGNPQAYNALGYSMADRNVNLAEASDLIAKAALLAPNDAFIMDSVGWIKYRQGDMSGAIKVLRQAFELRPNAEIGAHLGEVLWNSGAQDEARTAWRTARQLDPNDDTLVKTLQRFQVSDL
ncbi:tetratricopeptide repeat protein [Paraburkholderia hayleyella]|uniref:tetratricopeptide repeat protein n=1 Tax=Paraburkholderia hayleyella TaxID=2152889 RepID=UPI00129156A9|nr:tetratricopeptide repeat protein [Paraburkholderia hayleyella]